ncbi:MAG TPA: aldose epimerase [Acidobacteriaceae bacterium]
MSQHLHLQNGLLLAVIAPAEGGRVVSLVSQQSGLEFLLQSHHSLAPLSPSRTAHFGEGACAGIEECLPTVSKCEVNGEVIPDHGDFWQMEWRVLSPPHPNTICLTADGFSRPLRFTKTFALHNACLRIDYQIENIGLSPASFLYATHPLLAVDAGDSILLPEEVTSLTLHSSKDDRLGLGGDSIPWPQPTTDAPQHPGRILPVTAATADMFYTGKLHHGWCGLYRAQSRQGLALRFNTAVLPYLGLWICCGGWPESGTKQYAFAPEPTTAPCGSLQQALNHGVSTPLLPGRFLRFTIEFRAASAMSIDEFFRFAAHFKQ